MSLLKTTVFWRVGNSIQFGVIESIKTEENLDGFSTEYAIRFEAECGLVYKKDNEVNSIYGSYDSELVALVGTILTQLRKMYEKPSNEQTFTGTSSSDAIAVTPSTDEPL